MIEHLNQLDTYYKIAATLCLLSAVIIFKSRGTVPNWLPMSATLLFPVAFFFYEQPAENLIMHVTAGGFVFVITFFIFGGGYIGGGTAKLLSALALWVAFPITIGMIGLGFVFWRVIAIYTQNSESFFWKYYTACLCLITFLLIIQHGN